LTLFLFAQLLHEGNEVVVIDVHFSVMEGSILPNQRFDMLLTGGIVIKQLVIGVANKMDAS
jgi:hypothetical protein